MNAPPALSCGRIQILQDGAVHSGAELEARAERLAGILVPDATPRVALCSRRADVVVAALTACQTRNCELLLMRESPPLNDPIWAEWRVSALLDEGLRVHLMPGPAATTAGFRILLTTSGTTGRPKVARHTVEGLLGRIRPPRVAAESARWLLTYHPATFAGMQVLLTAMTVGAVLIAVSDSTVPALARQALQYAPTHVSATPTFWRGCLIALGSRAGEVPLQQATLGGEAVDQATLDRLRGAFPHAGLTHIYASTEAGALFAVRDGLAGFPAAWLNDEVDEVRLRNVDGMLEVLSPRRMEGYVAGAATSPVTPDGWLRTGDAVEVRGDRVMFLGRADTIINVGGAKVSPEEVEAVLLEVPVVADARVFAARNPITGQLVVADVVLREGAEHDSARREILAHSRARMPEYKVPRVIRFAGEIVASATGKKQRV